MASDMFLKITGIPGDSTSAKHKDEIEVLSFSWGATNPVLFSSGGGGSTGKVQVQDFSFVKEPDSATPLLLKAVCTGQHLQEALLTLVKPGDQQQEFMKITLSDCIITSYQTGGSAGMLPAEQVSFAFQKVELSINEQKADGSSSWKEHTCDFMKQA